MRLLSSDPVSRKRTRMHFQGDEEYVIEKQQDVEDIVERNKARMALQERHTRHGEWAQYAEIPVVVWVDLCRRGIAYDEKRLRKWLDDRDNLLFRTRPGSLSK